MSEYDEMVAANIASDKAIDDQVQIRAAQLWASFDENERHGVRFGLFPASKMDDGDQHRVCCALMHLAEKTPAAPKPKKNRSGINRLLELSRQSKVSR